MGKENPGALIECRGFLVQTPINEVYTCDKLRTLV